MFETGQLIRCQERKAELFQQSAAHRRILVTEAKNLSPVVAWVDLGLDVGRKAAAGWSVLAPVLPLWRGRNRSPAGVAKKIAGAFSFFHALKALWKNWH